MPSPDLATFLSVLIIMIALLVWWRAAIILVAALLIALLLAGLHELTGGIDLGPVGDQLVGPAPERAVPGTATSRSTWEPALNEQAHR